MVEISKTFKSRFLNTITTDHYKNTEILLNFSACSAIDRTADDTYQKAKIHERARARTHTHTHTHRLLFVLVTVLTFTDGKNACSWPAV